jgi:hypothetical protein
MIEIKHNGSYFSDLKLPQFNGVVHYKMNPKYEFSRQGKVIFFNITQTLTLIIGDNTYYPFTSKTYYQINTDGFIKDADLYSLYADSFKRASNALDLELKALKITPLDIQPQVAQIEILAEYKNWFAQEIRQDTPYMEYQWTLLKRFLQNVFHQEKS